MKDIATNGNSLCINKFRTLKLVENGVILIRGIFTFDLKHHLT